MSATKFLKYLVLVKKLKPEIASSVLASFIGNCAKNGCLRPLFRRLRDQIPERIEHLLESYKNFKKVTGIFKISNLRTNRSGM